MTKAIKECDLCGGKDFEFLFSQNDKNFGKPGTFKLYQCQNCETIITTPKLSPKELEKYYSKDYYAFDKIVTKENSVKVKLRLFLYKTYYSYPLRNKFLKALCLPFKFLVRGVRVIPGQRLLDVGCGSGQFLYEMKEFGMNVHGIEPGQGYAPGGVQKIKGFCVKPDLIKAKYPKETFDLITMNHVLQHVDNPSKMLKEIYKILNQDGLFIVSASNTRSLGYILFGGNWFQLDIPRHLFNCSDKILVQFLEEHGFKVIKRRHNSRPNQFVVSLHYMMGLKNKERLINKLLEVGFLPLTWLVNILKIGDQVEVWCIKK